FFARGGALYRRDKNVTAEFGSARALPPLDRIDATLTDGDGRLFVRTPSRLFVLPKGAPAFAPADDGLPAAAGTGTLALEPPRALLVPTRSGLARRDPAGTKVLGRREGLEDETILCAMVDREGSLYVGLAGA